MKIIHPHYNISTITITSSSTKAWLYPQSLYVIQWPTFSIDLNSVEKIWGGGIFRRIYASSKRYFFVDELETVIEEEGWGAILNSKHYKNVLIRKKSTFLILFKTYFSSKRKIIDY